MRQHGWVSHETRAPTIRVVEHDQVKFPAVSRNRSGNLSDSSEQTELLQQRRRDSTADVSHDDGLTRFDSKHMCRIYAHVGATDNYRLQSLEETVEAMAWAQRVLCYVLNINPRVFMLILLNEIWFEVGCC